MADHTSDSQVFVDDALLERLFRDNAASADRPQEAASVAPDGAQGQGAPPDGEAGLPRDPHAPPEEPLPVPSVQASLNQPNHDPFENHTRLGNLYFQKGAWEEAAGSYAAILEIDPHYAPARFNLAVCLERYGKLQEAEAHYAKALEADPRCWQAAFRRGLCLLKLGSAEAALGAFDAALASDHPKSGREAHKINFAKAAALRQLGRLDEAGQLYEQLLLAAPDSPKLLASYVLLSRSRKDEKRLRELAERLRKHDPASVLALRALAEHALGLSDYEAAIAFLLDLVKITPESFEAWFNLGVAYQRSGQPEEAIAAYRESLKIRPDSPEAHANLGAAFYARGVTAEAAKSYEQALALSPGMPGVLWNQALLSEREGNLDAACGWLKQLLHLRPDWKEAEFRLGYFKLQQADYSGAVESFRASLADRGGWAEARLNLGLALWKLGERESAAQAFQQLLSDQENNATALEALVRISLEQKQLSAALEWYRKLFARAPVLPELSYSLGLALQSAGQYSAAAECYQRAVEEAPDFVEALVNLGYVLNLAGKEGDAKQAWSRAVSIEPELACQFVQ